jgi:hypothetical protein
MRDRGVLRPLVVVLGMTTVLGVFGARCFQTARAYFITKDESFYITHGLLFWMTGNDRAFWQAGVPRLPQLVDTSLPYLLLRWSGRLSVPSQDLVEDLGRILESDQEGVLIPGRLIAIGWGMLTLLVTYWMVARKSGAGSGLVAAALLSMVPEMLAHSVRAAPDVPAVPTMLIAMLMLARYVERPSLLRWLTAGLAIGVAWATRHNAILLIPQAAGASLWVELRKHRPPGVRAIAKRLMKTACACVAVVAIAFLVLWATDGFATTPLVSAEAPSRALRALAESGPIKLSNLPIPVSLMSLKFQIGHAMGGHPAYFCGQLGSNGWKLYYPVAFLLKTPIGLLILIIVAAARVRLRGALDWILLSGLALLWIALVRNKIDIGLRYAILCYALVMPFVARLFDKGLLRDPIWGAITIAATLLFAWESVSCHPQYLSSFNRLGGGTSVGWLYLAEANLDYDQDIDAMVAELKRRRIDEITVAEGGLCDYLNRIGIRAFLVQELGDNDRALDLTPPTRLLPYPDNTYRSVRTRYIAVGINSMLGLRMIGFDESLAYQFSWLWTRRLVTRVNDSALIFDMDLPAETPFFQ